MWNDKDDNNKKLNKTNNMTFIQDVLETNESQYILYVDRIHSDFSICNDGN